ncbi:hypothetical protein [Lentilactobacillus sp. Marseille-Q4993]|uniref:hypothetical protein n=1 Tax=Lentilactobacillus sp. Marseille-Q4993 TaxID=3039492 RepID=UPI0024BC3ED1|nr:hypothetical protein [Lentilactobacillus sp. Marseille-Q4993]
MSNKLEILEEYKKAASELNQLKAKEGSHNLRDSNETVVIQPQFGDQMHELTNKCSQLTMIIEAMNASED